MSRPLVVSIPHRLGKDEAVRRLQSGLRRAASSIPVLSVDEERWDGDKIVLISFPDEYDFRAWAESAAYQELAPDRKAGAEAIVLLVRGFGERPDRTATLIRRRS